jgi:hypothetical protein
MDNDSQLFMILFFFVAVKTLNTVLIAPMRWKVFPSLSLSSLVTLFRPPSSGSIQAASPSVMTESHLKFLPPFAFPVPLHNNFAIQRKKRTGERKNLRAQRKTFLLIHRDEVHSDELHLNCSLEHKSRDY